MPTPRWLFPIALLVTSATVIPACSGSDDPGPAADGDEAVATTTEDFCILFPARDANVMLEAVKDPQLEGNDDMVEALLEMGAKGLVEKSPPSLKGAVETYTAAMRDWQPGQDLTSDPQAQAAVSDINAWLRANCGPPDTGPPGSMR
jgi:hypothetical protein